jgi:hypothetical protein
VKAIVGIQKKEMRRLGFIILILSFLVIVGMATMISSHTHSAWIWHTQQLATHTELTQDVASSEMRDLSLGFNRRFRLVLIPASGMLLGGLLAAMGKPSQKNSPKSEFSRSTPVN